MNHYLFIDDDEIIAMIHPAVIRRVDANCDIEICEEGSSALEYLNHLLSNGGLPPNFIFLDINMPLMSGFEFLDNLSENLIDFLKDSKVIMLSSSIDPRDTKKAENYPLIRDFASKPLTVEYLNQLLTI